MNRLSRYRLLFVTIMCIFVSFSVRAIDIGPTVWLDRYTVQPDGSIIWDNGHLLSSGRFVAVTSETLDPTEIDPNFDYYVISGRPICSVEIYQGYKASHIIPHWVRSRDEFPIGFDAYVIVSIVGGQDPNPTISIQQQPEGGSVLSSWGILLSVNASPMEYLSYQWVWNGEILPGQTSDLLFLTPAESKPGNYWVLLNTGGKNVASAKAHVSVIEPVVIITQPKPQTVKESHGLVLRVAAKGTGPFGYHWFLDGNDAPGIWNKSFYTIPHITSAEAGDYFVMVTNSLSFATSQGAVVTVVP